MKTFFFVSSLLFLGSASAEAPRFESQRMDLQELKIAAFKSCQAAYQAPKPVPIPVLDPPAGGPEDVGMVFQEELAVRSRNFLDRDGFYFSPRPRAAVNSIPMKIFIDESNSGNYVLKTWEDAEIDFSSSVIQPPIDKATLPDAGKVLTELVIGHQSPKGDYPQLFDLRSSAYFRFAGYPPQITGASLRLGVHDISGLDANGDTSLVEDFPVVRAVYASIKSRQTAKALVLVESKLFCGALDMEMTEGSRASVLVDSYWYTREDFEWKKSPHTAFIAYSSMLWKTEKETPQRDSDEAHDSDTLRVNFVDGKRKIVKLQARVGKVVVQDLTAGIQSPVRSWSLANEDRDPRHYADFASALGATNYDKRASYHVDVLDSSIKTAVTLYEIAPVQEYLDNIVAASTLRGDIKKAQNPSQAVHFKYRTTAY